jgi:DNA-binding response OmpR family regulator
MLVRLLIIEDERDMAAALCRGLRRQGYAVDVALDGRDGWDMGEINEYDLLILDLCLPGMDGLEVCRRLRESKPSLLVMMLTARDRTDQRCVGLDAGADDYIVKPFAWQEFLARVRALLRRDVRSRPLVLECEGLRFDQVSRTAWRDGCRLYLTGKETGILEYLMHHQGEPVSQEDLLEHIWGEDEVDPLTNTVRVHINSLRRKLGDEVDNPAYIHTVIGKGYRLGIPASPEAVS